MSATLKEYNMLPVVKRMKELFFDYAIILLYLVILFAVTITTYKIWFGGVPAIDELQAQLVALTTSVIPIVLLFSYRYYSHNGRSGKQKAGLILVYKHKSMGASLVGNCIKFLPWQLGFMATIRGIYTNFDSLSIAFSVASMTLGLVLFLMAILRKDKRHIGDLLSHTQVQLADN